MVQLPKRFGRKTLSIIVWLLLNAVAITLPVSVFVLAYLGLTTGWPILFALWKDQPTLHSLLLVSFVLLGGGIMLGGVAGASMWVRFVHKVGLTREGDVWPFGKRAWNWMWMLSDQKEKDLPLTGCLGVYVRVYALAVWALLGAAAALVIGMPLFLAMVGATPISQFLQVLSLKLSTPGEEVQLVPLILTLILGSLVSIPVATYLWFKFSNYVLGLTDDELNGLIQRRPRLWK